MRQITTQFSIGQKVKTKLSDNHLLIVGIRVYYDRHIYETMDSTGTHDTHEEWLLEHIDDNNIGFKVLEIFNKDYGSI